MCEEGGRGKRTSISQLIECRFYRSPDMKQAIHSKPVMARGAFDSLAPSAFQVDFGLYVGRNRPGGVALPLRCVQLKPKSPNFTSVSHREAQCVHTTG